VTWRQLLARALERDRGELRLALSDLRRSAVHQLAPRERLRQNPYAWLGAAAGVGLWWAWRSAPRRH
jgi:hypothetical protein